MGGAKGGGFAAVPVASGLMRDRRADMPFSLDSLVVSL